MNYIESCRAYKYFRKRTFYYIFFGTIAAWVIFILFTIATYFVLMEANGNIRDIDTFALLDILFFIILVPTTVYKWREFKIECGNHSFHSRIDEINNLIFED